VFAQCVCVVVDAVAVLPGAQWLGAGYQQHSWACLRPSPAGKLYVHWWVRKRPGSKWFVSYFRLTLWYQWFVKWCSVSVVIMPMLYKSFACCNGYYAVFITRSTQSYSCQKRRQRSLQPQGAVHCTFCTRNLVRKLQKYSTFSSWLHCERVEELSNVYYGCAGSVVVSTLRYHAKGQGFAPRPGRSLLRLIPFQALPAHSAVMSRLGINLVEGKATREDWPPPSYAVAENQAVANASRPRGPSCLGLRDYLYLYYMN